MQSIGFAFPPESGSQTAETCSSGSRNVMRGLE